MKKYIYLGLGIAIGIMYEREKRQRIIDQAFIAGMKYRELPREKCVTVEETGRL